MYKKAYHNYNKTRPLTGWSNQKPSEYNNKPADLERLDWAIRRLQRYLFKNAENLSKEEIIDLKIQIADRRIFLEKEKGTYHLLPEHLKPKPYKPKLTKKQKEYQKETERKAERNDQLDNFKVGYKQELKERQRRNK